jgi:preprotein translocase subunit SecG
MKILSEFMDDERGDTSTVFNLVLAITVIAAVLVILLFVLQKAQGGGQKLTSTMNETAGQLNSNLTNFTESG